MGYNPEIDLTIVGRYSPTVGIGQKTEAFFHGLKDRLNINFLDVRNGHSAHQRISPDQFAAPAGDFGNVSIYTDVVWNGRQDYTVFQVPQTRVKIAYSMFDSSELPAEWVGTLNDRFDSVAVPSPYLKNLYQSQGVTKPVFVVPMALDLQPFLGRKTLNPITPNQNRPFRFGSISAFHPRKNYHLLITSFLKAFGPKNSEAELVIHSNLQFGNEWDRLSEFLKRSGAQNVTLSHSELSNEDLLDLIDSFDAFVLLSGGEGFSIGPRQAMALGKPCILSGIGAHQDLIDSGTVTGLRASLAKPAYYPEIDQRCFGLQYDCYESDVIEALKRQVQQKATDQQKKALRSFASQFDLPMLKYTYRSLVKPLEVQLGSEDVIREDGIITQSKELKEKYLGFTQNRARFFQRPKQITRKVLMGHDGGFFSVFNLYLSHLVWNQDRGSIRHILPDWRIGSMQKALNTQTFTSFCYGRPEDGNIWLKLFEPVYEDVPAEAYHTDELLYEGANSFFHDWNSEKEPYLTYVHAYNLYKRPDFLQWRRWYHHYYKKYIRVNSTIAKKVKEVQGRGIDGNYCIGMHVRHPSHAIEQPGQRIAHFDQYINQARHLLKEKDLLSRKDWRIFLATDQEKVVRYFRSEFGDHLVTVDGQARTSEEQDKQFESLSKEEKMKEGFQIQHRMASDSQKWSHHLAEEVIIDALLLASCNTLLHTTSNVSTAVAFMNPDVEMIYCQ